MTKEKVKKKLIAHSELSLQRIEQFKTTFKKVDCLNLLKGMLLTRATDNGLKKLFLSGEIDYLGKGFQGKGFRSLGQEAIFGAAYFLRRTGSARDIVAPLIRDLGVFLCCSDADVETAINAQAGKSGLPCDGRDLHLGDFEKGILMPAAPLAIATCTLVGLAQSFKLKKEARVGISFIGEGGSSLGEWHEAINYAASAKLPMVFCIQNNQTALSTPVKEQSAVRSFADKALGYGMPSLCLNGNDIEEVAAGFNLAADYARAGRGPVLIELTTMRMCGHAHHDDMLYLGYDPPLGFSIVPSKKGGYVDEKLYEYWRLKDPIENYKKTLIARKMLNADTYAELEKKATEQVEEAIIRIKKRPWPSFVGHHDESLVYKKPYIFSAHKEPSHYQFDADGITYLQAIAESLKAAFLRWPEAYVIGEDVAPPYGNAFMMFKSIMNDFPKRFINTPISENAIVGACVGLALSGMRPVGEIQFNDFVACAMNQVVNNAAKHYFRTGLNLPMTLRMPYGGLRRAGPFHSQDTAAWFYRSAGLKIYAPSTPNDAYHMLLKAIDDPDPVLFYEHIALYREPKIKQKIKENSSVDGAAVILEGNNITIISYGAYIHSAFNSAKLLHNKYNISAEIIDLRYLKPIDFASCHASIKKTGRALLLTEDAREGSIMQSLAGRLGYELFPYLDAPIEVVGARDIPVPYAPSLEDDYLVSEEEIIKKICQLMAF